MYIHIDFREILLYDVCVNLINENKYTIPIQINKQNLSVGDIIFYNNENIPIIIIERKTLSDLVSSIKDGRYKEQSYRLKNYKIHNHNIIYLIEGNFNDNSSFFHKKYNKNEIFSSYISLLYYKGFSVIKTDSTHDSALFIINTFLKIHKENMKNNKPYYTNNNEEINEHKDNDKLYIENIKIRKKDNITKDNISEIMLCQIPGISCITSTAIMKKFHNITNLIIELQKDKKCLDDIYIENIEKEKKETFKTSYRKNN